MDLAKILFRLKAKTSFHEKPQSYYLLAEILVKTNIFAKLWQQSTLVIMHDEKTIVKENEVEKMHFFGLLMHRCKCQLLV
jgi:hypothetical protein